jgi:DNA-binding transcriptional MerR regulator
MAIATSGAQTHALTIEQLAAESGMTVRTIREHRARGLLPPPTVRERVGYYGRAHLDRLRVIRELQLDGFNLRGIKRLLEQTKGPPEQLLGLRRAVTAPFETEEPEVFTLDELEQRFGPDVPADAVAKAVKIGAIVPLGEDRYEVPAPSLLELAADVVRLGVPLHHVMAVVERVEDKCESISQAFVRLFLEDVWKPFAERGYPEERWTEVVATIEQLRPLASRALLGVFQITMSREVEVAFGRELDKLSRGKR